MHAVTSPASEKRLHIDSEVADVEGIGEPGAEARAAEDVAKSDVTPEELLIRRFCPTRADHVLFDEGQGEFRLNYGALVLRKGENGVSVYRKSILESSGLDEQDVAVSGYEGTATVSVRRVGSVPPFYVQPDPWPQGESVGPPVDVGHALICPALGNSGNQVKKALKLLSRHFGDLRIPDERATRLALSQASG